MKKKACFIIGALLFALIICGCGSGDTAVPELKVSSDILGLADTGNKTTLKVDLIKTGGPGDTNIYHYNEDGERVVYENQEEQCVRLAPVTYTGSAILDLGDNVKDKWIDSSKATVKMIDGNGYYADEFILNANTLDGAWKDGKYTYTLDAGDIAWNTWGYDTSVDYNSNREWSIMGGDGNGVYALTLEVSGILYDGREVAPAKIPVYVYCYGRTCTDMALGVDYVPNEYDSGFTSGLKPGAEIQWTWTNENPDSIAQNKPYMNDGYTDYISIVWPEGTDVSGITAEDVTVTLNSRFGDEKVLSTRTAYGEEEYTVFNNGGETVVAVTYQQWSCVPVYSTMTVSVNHGDLTVSETFDICSVAAYMVQTGGGGVEIDHTVTCYNFYGISGMNEETALNPYYMLSTEIAGTKYYYAEDASGKASLTEKKEEAWLGDGTEKYNIAVRGNVVFAEKRADNTEEKTVDGKTYVFQQEIARAYKLAAEMVEAGAELQDGYNLKGKNSIKWAWTLRYQSGWTYGTPQPAGLPYVEGCYPYGYEA
ncbi:MAG: hypothetical protein ACI3WQ_00555, partial [Faecousia sp.]